MCGIVGGASKIPFAQRDWLRRASETIKHRGPDDNGEWWSSDKKVGLAHRRLSIVDLSPSGHQPMFDDSGDYGLIFNGEIYNHLELRHDLISKGFNFKSSSDSEVILASYTFWGIDCLKHFNGMFSFAIYDAKEQRIFLARDRSGEKPLFYYKDEYSIFFASELKALFEIPFLKKNINWRSLDTYLSMGYVPGASCMVNGFSKLPPGMAMIFDLTSFNLTSWKYWEKPLYDGENTSILNEKLLLDELDKLLESSVSNQLNADVPVGIFLSGGLDSSLITAFAARCSSDIHTFTVGFPDSVEHDETKHASLIANHFGTTHTVLRADPSNSDLLVKLARQFDEPIVDSSMIPMFLISELVSTKCKVALGGDGGDELFGGYGHYSKLKQLQEKARYVPFFIRKIIAYGAENYTSTGFAGRNINNWLEALGKDLYCELPQIAKYFNKSERAKLLLDFPNYVQCAESIYLKSSQTGDCIIQSATRTDFDTYLPEDLLVKVDRASMLNSLEIRAPMLDQHLIEFAFSKVPSHLKATAHNKKILLKSLASRVLPEEFQSNRKQGFSIPLNSWLKKGSFRDLFYDILLCEDCIFNRNTTEKMLNDNNKGYNNGESLFALVQFELWRKEYNILLN